MLPSAAVAGDQRTPAPVFATCMAMAASAGDQAAVLAAWRHMRALSVLPNDACRTAFIQEASRSHDQGNAPCPAAVWPCGNRPTGAPSAVITKFVTNTRFSNVAHHVSVCSERRCNWRQHQPP